MKLKETCKKNNVSNIIVLGHNKYISTNIEGYNEDLSDLIAGLLGQAPNLVEVFVEGIKIYMESNGLTPILTDNDFRNILKNNPKYLA